MTETIDENADPSSTTEPGEGLPATSGRVGAFTDAVVAIALTLLILPLMEAIPEPDRANRVADYLSAHSSQLISFGISFVLIAAFWLLHHRVFRADTPMTSALMWINFGWLLTIVVMPVVTALTASMHTDRLILAIYIGTLLINSALTLALTEAELRARRSSGLRAPNRSILAAPLAMMILFAVTLAVDMVWPGLGYYTLLLLTLTGLLRVVLIRAGVRD